MVPGLGQRGPDVARFRYDPRGVDRHRVTARLALALAHRMPDLDVFRQAVSVAESGLAVPGPAAGNAP